MVNNLSWSNTVRRRVYRVQGANALWHQDGNEKLRPWGFYVHGCINGFSRMITYLSCKTNKCAVTVKQLFQQAINRYGTPSQVRGDFGMENNGIEELMILLRSTAHEPYIRGK